MSAITIMEIVLLFVSVICFAVSFLIPEKKPEGSGIDQELAREEVKEMVKQEVDNIKGHVDDVVRESMDYAMEKTERSLERLSNEKIMAVNEYSDSVMQEIHKNHEEVVFLYDMLNNKHDSLKKTVAEASKAAKVMQDSVESIQSFRPVAVSYGEGSVKIAPLASKRKEEVPKQKAKEEYDNVQNPGTENAKAENEDKQEKETRESLKNWKPEVKPYEAPDSNRIVSQALGEEKNMRPIFSERVMNAIPEDDPQRNVETAAEVHLEDDGNRNQNDKILELHKQGKSNVAIAKELGMGVGEVKLVIDLYKNA